MSKATRQRIDFKMHHYSLIYIDIQCPQLVSNVEHVHNMHHDTTFSIILHM
ncbi:unnamed protein product, partial [Prunus armeniaca]